MTSRLQSVRIFVGCAMSLAFAFFFWRSVATIRLDAPYSTDSSPQSAAGEVLEQKHPAADNPEALAEFRRARRADATGSIAPGALFRAKQQADALRSNTGSVAAVGVSPSDWVWLGPGNVGGRVRSILIHPTSPNIMWAGATGGGVWKTVNGGAMWVPLDDFMANLAVSTMAMHPSDPDTFYVGTGDDARGAGVFKCINGGDTCTKLTSTTGSSWFTVNSLAIDPGDPRHILAATNTGIFETHDAGACWSSRWSTFTKDIKFDPTDGSKAVAGGANGQIWYATNSSDFACGTIRDWTDWTPSNVAAFSASLVSVGLDPDSDDRDLLLLDSTAGFRANERIMIGTGATQETVRVQRIVDGTQLVVKQNLTSAHASGEAVVVQLNGRVELAYFGRPPSDDLVYASMDIGDGTVFRSIDGGQNFDFVSRTGHLGGLGGHANSIWVDPTNSELLVLAGVGIYRSSDHGQTTEFIGCFSHADHHVLVSHPDYDGGANKTLFSGNDGGIFVTNDILSPDNTTEGPDGCRDFGWTALNGSLGTTLFLGGTVSPTTGLVFGGTQDNGTLLYSGDINGWTSAYGGDGGACAMGPTPTIFFGEYSNLDLFRFTPGEEVEFITKKGDCGPGSLLDGNQCRQDTLFVAPIISDPNDRNRVLAGAARLWRSHDAGTADSPTWTFIRDYNWIDPPDAENRRRVKVSAVTVVDGNPNDIWVGYTNGDLFRTVNGLATSPNWFRWNDEGSGLPMRTITEIAVDTHNPLLVYVALSGYADGNLQALRRSAPGIFVWESATGSGSGRLPFAPINTVVVHPNNPGWLYVGTDVGIFVSQNDGASWSATNEGPANVEVDKLVWQDDETLIAFTYGRGVYRATGIIPDCNGNGRSDHLDLGDGTLSDCNANLRPDECEAGDTTPDCNANLIPDVCELGVDCNGNGIPDDCDPDCDNNGQPDDCDLAAVGQLRFLPNTLTPVVGGGATSVVAADFDLNGFADLASANQTDTSVAVVFNLGRDASNNWLGWDSSVDVYNMGGASAVPWSLAVNDFDGDLFPDLAVLSGNDDLIPRLQADLLIGVNGGDGGVRPPGVFGFHTEWMNITGINPQSIVAGDFDRDGAEDLAIADTDGVHVIVVFNSGPKRLHSVGPDPIGLATGFFTRDIDLDIVSVNGTFSELVVMINDGTGGFTVQTPIILAQQPSAVIAADLNGDRLDDIVVALKGDDSILVFFSNGDGTFASPVPYDTGTATAVSLVSADFNLDRAPDIAVGHDPGGLVAVLLNDGFGGLLAAQSFVMNSATSLVAIDLDGDRDNDLAGVTGTGARIWVALNNTIFDCDRNGRPDSCDIEFGAADLDRNGVPDRCERGCDADGDGDCDTGDWAAMLSNMCGPDTVCGGTALLALVPHPTDMDGDRDTDLYDVAIFLRGLTGNLSCCAPGGRGCIDPIVSGCVCAAMPSCCADAWTVRCVEAVETLLCATCNNPPPCGDGLCDSTEDCFNCPRDCGPCDGLCCQPNGTPGCADPSTQACVCDQIPHCCDDIWDQSCADRAASGCAACCGNGVCDASETCTDCPNDCGVCDPFCGNDRCETGETCGNCSLDCRDCTGNCCIPNPSPGCEDRTVMSCVCAMKPECCDGPWSIGCAGLSDDCGVCNEPCCTIHDATGCEDEPVEECVCSLDITCCTEKWHAFCVELAIEECSGCPDICGNHICDGEETCGTCAEDCGVCPPVCGDNNCDSNEHCGTCPQDCGGCSGTCCVANSTVGCNDPAVQACVCAVDSSCCTQGWHQGCGALADGCGVCNGDCCEPHGDAGCADSQIEQCVCAQNPSCCDTKWNEACVDEVIGLQCGECVRGDPPVVVISVPQADTSTSDIAFAYDGFDANLQMWFKDVALDGKATDLEDGELAGASLVWRTNRGDIQPGGVTLLGTGNSINVRLYSNLCVGVWHEITLTATDSDGNVVSVVRRIFIWTLC